MIFLTSGQLFTGLIYPKNVLLSAGMSLFCVTAMTPAQAQDGGAWDSSKVVNLISNRVVEAVVSAACTFAQVSYDNVTYDRHTERFYLSNLYVVPFD